MALPTFNQAANLPIYVLDIPDASIAFWARRFVGAPLATVPSSLSLAQTWNEPGVYILLKAMPLLEDFVVALQQLLLGVEFQSVRFLWLDNPTESLVNWRYTGLSLEPVAAGDQPGAMQLTQPAAFDWRNFSLFMAGGSRIRLSDAGAGFTVTQAADNPESIYLETNTGANRLTGIGSALELPFTGPTAGCWQFDLTLRQSPPPAPDQAADQGSGRDRYSELIALNIGLRLFFPDPHVRASGGTSFGVRSLHYPFLAEDLASWQKPQPQPDLILAVSLDPLQPLQGDRSYFRFINPAANASENVSAISLPSGYRSNIGYTIHLTPRPGARLVFSLSPTASTGSETAPESAPLYLVPAGDFVMTIPPYGATAPQNRPDYENNLICGISAVEYIKLAPQHTNLLCFRSGQPAFASSFVPGQSIAQGTPTNTDQSGTESGNAAAAILSPFATTAWSYVQQLANDTPQSPVYFAQPDQAILYRALGSGSENPLLRYLEVPTIALKTATALPAATPPLFPLLPYGGVQSEALGEYQALEQQILTISRRQQIQTYADHTAALATNQSDAIRGTTPQGLLATYTDNYATLDRLLLALDTENKPLQWRGIERTSPLRTALQSNHLWVISQPKSLRRADTQQTYFPDNQVTIAGWTLDLNPDHWRPDTVLIFKFTPHRLVDVLANLQTWSQPGLFNTQPETVQRQVLQLLQRVSDRVLNGTDKDRENYAALHHAATVPEWAGILALNVKVPPSNLPPELRALAAGINGDQFFAQYLGIETTPIHTRNGQLEADQSSLFGLIDYQNNAIPVPTESGYDFQVTSLRVLFQNSQVKAFSSEIAVTIDKLFDEKTQLLNSPSGRNLVVLKGTAESHNGKTTYAFSFSGDNHFTLPASLVLNEVEIIKAQFATDPGGGSTIVGRFTFWGRLNFRQLRQGKPGSKVSSKTQNVFDVLSFGTEPLPDGSPLALPGDAPPENDRFLTFSNLLITLSFPESNPSDRSFIFDPNHLQFDTTRSKARADSLYNKFPLKLTGLLYSPGDKTTNDYGYMPVKAPLAAKLEAGQPWYGFTYDLQLGTLGALAGKAGLVASLIVAWSPDPQAAGIFMGLRLPGSTGGKREISIQGILKIVFKSIEFVAGTNQGKVSYLLKLKNIVIKFLILSIPPNAQTEIIIFGDPAGTAENNTVGWYAAYVKD